MLPNVVFVLLGHHRLSKKTSTPVIRKPQRLRSSALAFLLWYPVLLGARVPPPGQQAQNPSPTVGCQP
jgi:hypothetical protein